MFLSAIAFASWGKKKTRHTEVGAPMLQAAQLFQVMIILLAFLLDPEHLRRNLEK